MTNPGAGPVATVSVTDDQTDAPVDVERWRRLAEGVLAERGIAGAVELNLLFVDEATIAELNARHLGSDGPTDVLAFPLDDVVGSEPQPADGPPLFVGDVVLCPVVAERNAPTHAGTYEDEIALLVVHGILHLLGMDHAEDDERREMQASEQQLLERLHR